MTNDARYAEQKNVYWTNCYCTPTVWKKRTYVQFLTSACISLMGLLGAAIKYAWRAQHTGKCMSNFQTYFSKKQVAFKRLTFFST